MTTTVVQYLQDIAVYRTYLDTLLRFRRRGGLGRRRRPERGNVGTHNRTIEGSGQGEAFSTSSFCNEYVWME